MIERASEFGNSTAAVQAASDVNNLTAGGMLRQARESHGLHIDVVAAAMKVPTKKLQALEDDDIDSLPDPVFARALAASVCRALRVDPAPVLAKLPGALRPGLADADRTISSSFRSGAPRSGRGSGLPSRAVLVVVALLLVAAALIFWLPQGIFGRLSASLAGQTTSAPKGDAAVEPGTVAPAGTVLESVTAMPAPANAMPSATVAAAAVETAAAAPALPATDDILVFTARAESWITVNETGSKQLLRRTLKAGETIALSGKPPMSVVVGRASGIDVKVHGKAFDLAPVTGSGGVARFEVKS
ncbi:MAG: helix-turn-helix domain-containing protein [Janthinobacterium lividum]